MREQARHLRISYVLILTSKAEIVLALSIPTQVDYTSFVTHNP